MSGREGRCSLTCVMKHCFSTDLNCVIRGLLYTAHEIPAFKQFFNKTIEDLRLFAHLNSKEILSIFWNLIVQKNIFKLCLSSRDDFGKRIKYNFFTINESQREKRAS